MHCAATPVPGRRKPDMTRRSLEGWLYYFKRDRPGTPHVIRIYLGSSQPRYVESHSATKLEAMAATSDRRWFLPDGELPDELRELALLWLEDLSWLQTKL